MSDSKKDEELKIKYLEDDEVEVNGEHYSSLREYFKHREKEVKGEEKD